MKMWKIANQKSIEFVFRDVYGNVKEKRTYTITFGDYVLVKSTLSGNPYWHTRDFYEQNLKNKDNKIIDTGTVYVNDVGTYYRDYGEFLQSMRLLRATPAVSEKE